MKLVRFFHTNVQRCECLTAELVNRNCRGLENVITGPIHDKAKELEEEIEQGNTEYSNNVMLLNIGDAQSLDQSPLTFCRQIMASVVYPDLLGDKTMPEDVKIRAKNILEHCPGGSVGSYSDIYGLELIRRQVAKYIEKRDNVVSYYENCILGEGVSDLARKFLTILKFDENGLKSGILNPAPEYPFYSTTIAELGLRRIDYYMDEDNRWDININELQKSIDEAKTSCYPRAIIVINPGNPTGHILSKQNMEEIVEFAHRENLIIIADEVYQNNILKDGCSFISFKKVINDMGKPYSDIELVSFMSVSEGIFAENGIRGGYAEIINFDHDIPSMFLRLFSTSCPSVLGQTALYCLVNRPNPDEPSYEQFEYEKRTIMNGLKMSASIVEESIHSLEGMSCNPVEGAIFFYPRIRFPQSALETAAKMKLSPDELYALELLQETGICVAPGFGFRQKPGSHHIRMTLSSDPDEVHQIMERIKMFHSRFMNRFLQLNVTRMCQVNE